MLVVYRKTSEKTKKYKDLSGREGKSGLLTLAKCLLLEVLSSTIYIHSCCFFLVKKEKTEPAKQTIFLNETAA